MKSLVCLTAGALLAGSVSTAAAQSIALTHAACGKLLAPGTYHLNYNLSCSVNGPKLQSNTTVNGNGYGPVRNGARTGIGWTIVGTPATPVANVIVRNARANGYVIGVGVRDAINVKVTRTFGQSASHSNGVGLHAQRVSGLQLIGVAFPANDAGGIVLEDLYAPKIWRSSANSNGGPGLQLSNVHGADISNSQFLRNDPDLLLTDGSSGNRAHCTQIGHAESDGTAVDNTSTCP